MEPNPKKQKGDKGGMKDIPEVVINSSHAPKGTEENSIRADANKITEKIITPDKPITESNVKNTKGEVRRIRTYKEDIAEAVRTQKASLTSIAAAEQRRRSGLPIDGVIKKHTDYKKVGIILGSVLFIIIGIGIISFFVFFYEEEGVTIEQEIPSFIFVEEQKEINTTGKNSREILQDLGNKRTNTSLSLGQIAHLYVTKTTQEEESNVTRVISAEEFLRSIRAQVSDAFLRSIEQDFILGVHVFNQNQPFIILKSNSYQHSFAGILEWERTMYNDLFLFMGRKVDPELNIITDPQTGEEIKLRESFEDKIVRNIDVRALLSESGNIEFLYAFPDQQTIIITTNENTLIEVITRLKSVRIF